jgi:hypothetical protein
MDEVLKAIYTGKVNIGNREFPCAVLQDETRIITQSAFLRALGRSRSPKAGTGVMSTVDGLPFFLQAKALNSFIDEELRQSTAPIFYETSKGKIEAGYNALLLPKIAEVYLRYRDHELEISGKIPKQYQHIIQAADILIRGLAHVGIIALIDEATGYQYIRTRSALEEILERFITNELRKWVKTFPDEFYMEMFRLKGWVYDPSSVSRPSVIGTYTNDLVYDRLAPSVRKELERLNPKNSKGNRVNKHFQYLTEDVGHPRLREHLSAVIVLMRISNNWDDFKLKIDKALPRYGETYEIFG